GEKPLALEFLQKLIPGKESTNIPPEYAEYTSDIIIEIGTDYTNSKKYIEDPFKYMVDLTPTIDETAGESSSDQ
ncbi:hypothetical protein KJ632_04195, partial [Patescibacteria group bacterium]|nr:hypothetical protein [Patescibacteria group bacterium]